MKSNKSNKLKYFRYIICILLIILLIKASYRSYICSLLYEKDAVSIVKQEDTNYFLYNSNDEINNNEIKEKFILLSGNNFGIFATCISSTFIIPLSHILNNFNFDSK